MVEQTLIPIFDVLVDKKGERKEAHLILFEYCNLACSFCHQDHDSVEGIDLIQVKVQTLIAHTEPDDNYIINITGGELFLDIFDDNVFEEYYKAGKTLLTHFKNATLSFGTNLVYNQPDRVEQLVKRLRKFGEVVLSTSYDPAGRFNAESKKLFFTNLELLKEYVHTVNVVITKQNIEMILKGQEGPEFKFLCDNYKVYFDHYIPSELYTQHQPTEDMIGQLYMVLNVKYPNSYPLKDWKRNHFNSTTCRSTKIINKSNVVTTCWSEAGKDSILDEGKGLIAKHKAEEAFLERYQCHACEYFSRCGLRCFLHHSFVTDDDAPCQVKLMFDAIIE
jgi:MoaA/NifB/PqqE/SkfB family radical SAM enzyme